MKHILVLTIALISVLHAGTEDTASSLQFRDLYDREIRLEMDRESTAWVLVYFSNTCPVARRYMPRIAQLETDYGARGVRFVGINASPADSLDEVGEFARSFEIAFPVLKDVTFASVRALGVTRTPEVVVLNRDFMPVYKGRIDDQYRLGGVRPTATRQDLKEALDALLAGRAAPESHVPAEGCAITFPEDSLSPVIATDGRGEPGGPFTHEFQPTGKREPGEAPDTRVWTLAPTIPRESWINALEVEGPAGGVTLFYVDLETPGTRRLVAGALTSGQRLQWNADEGIRLPAGARLQAALPTGAESTTRVRLKLQENPPARELFCSRDMFPVRRDQTEAPRLLQSIPLGAALRCVAADYTGYGASLVIALPQSNQTTASLLAIPVLNPARPTARCLGEAFQLETAPLHATLAYPGYLRSPRATPGVRPEDEETTLSIYLHWSLPS